MGVLLMEPDNSELAREGKLTNYPSKIGYTSYTMAVNDGPQYYREALKHRETGYGPHVGEPICFKIQSKPQTSFDQYTNAYVNDYSRTNANECNTTDTNKLSTMPPPKKKWIKEYMEEEPRLPSTIVATLPSLRSNGIIIPPRAISPVHSISVNTAVTSNVNSIQQHNTLTYNTSHDASQQHLHHEHSRTRTITNGTPTNISISSTSAGCSTSSHNTPGVVRAGTREVHNKLEKNRRAHLKECFELLKRQLPATPDDKKTSNLSILGSAIRFIQVLKRRERECEHEMERLAREKIAAQQRLAALKRDITARQNQTLRIVEPLDQERDDRVNGQLLGIPISITTPATMVSSGCDHTTVAAQSLNLSTNSLHTTLPVNLTDNTTAQIVQPRKIIVNGQAGENGLKQQTINTTLVHPAHIHLPLSQVVREGSLVVAGALQLVPGPGGALRVLQPNGTATRGELTRLHRENGTMSPSGSAGETNFTPPIINLHNDGSVVVAPLVVSQALLTHPSTTHITHKMVESQVVKGAATPLTVNAQYLGTTTIVKPVVVVTTTSPTLPKTT